MSEAELLTRLCEWYQAQCDGNWEHGPGIKIATLDNPGWLVKINLRGTTSAARPFPEVDVNDREDDWWQCSVKNEEFTGAGHPSKLTLILDHFLRHAVRP